MNGGGCGVSGGHGHQTGSPGCLAGMPCPPCAPSGDGSDGNGTLWKSLCLAGGRMTFWSRSPPARSAPPSLCHGPCLTLGADQIGRQEVEEALRSGAQCVAQALQHWGMGGSMAARWDGMMCLGGI